MIHCYTIGKCIALCFLEKFFIAVDRNELRHPQLDNVQRMRDVMFLSNPFQPGSVIGRGGGGTMTYGKQSLPDTAG